MKYIYYEKVIWENNECDDIDSAIEAFCNAFPFLFMWTFLIEWNMEGDTIYMETMVEGHKTISFYYHQWYIIPFYLGMMVKEVYIILSLLFPEKVFTCLLYFDKWYYPRDEFVSLPFSSTTIEIDESTIPNVVRVK
jgi:hypothetical protein